MRRAVLSVLMVFVISPLLFSQQLKQVNIKSTGVLCSKDVCLYSWEAAQEVCSKIGWEWQLPTLMELIDVKEAPSFYIDQNKFKKGKGGFWASDGFVMLQGSKTTYYKYKKQKIKLCVICIKR